MMDGYFLHIKGNIEEKFRQKDNWDLRIQVMSLLSEMRDKMTKSLTVCIDVNMLSTKLLDDIQRAINENNQKYPVQNCKLRFQIKDREEAMLVELASKNFKVSPSDDLMADIFNLTNVQPVLN
jgi:DNA polymerase-3 subunit alpha